MALIFLILALIAGPLAHHFGDWQLWAAMILSYAGCLFCVFFGDPYRKDKA